MASTTNSGISTTTTSTSTGTTTSKKKFRLARKNTDGTLSLIPPGRPSAVERKSLVKVSGTKLKDLQAGLTVYSN